MLKTLLTIDSNTLSQCLRSLEPSDHSGLQNEERGLLFTIHTQFILFNLTFVSKSIVSIPTSSLLKYYFVFQFHEKKSLCIFFLSSIILQKNWPDVQKAVLHYLGSLFKIGTEIFKHGQKSVVETHANETVTKVHELFSDESAIPSKYFYIFQTHIKFSLLHFYCIFIAYYGM